MSQFRSNGRVSQSVNGSGAQNEDAQGEVVDRPRATGYRMKPGGGPRFAKYAGEQFENPTEIVLQKLEAQGCQPLAKGADLWESLCPVHANDGLHHERNLQIAVGQDGDCVVHCFAHQCDRRQIAEALGLQEFHLFRPRPESRNGQANGQTNGKPKPDRTHVYQDQHGDAVYRSRRRNGSWSQDRYDVALGTFVGGNGCMKGVTLVPYMLPELLRRLQDAPTAFVCIAEGEKDVEALWDLGWPATCNVGGADKWRDEYTEWFKGRNVVVFQDNDEAGRRHVQKVAGSCSAAGCKVRVIGMPEPHKDVADFIAAGGEKAKLVELIKETPLWTSPVESETKEPETKKSKYKIRTFGEVAQNIGDLVHLWENWLLCGNINMIFSLPKVGKSRFYLSIVKSLWFGTAFPDGAPNPWPAGTKSVIIPYDNNHGEIARDLKRWGVPDEAAICPSDPEDDKGIRTLELQSPLMVEVLNDIFEHEPMAKFLVIDTLTYATSKNLCKPEDVKALVDPLMEMSARYQLCPLVLVHEAAGGKAYGRRLDERARMHLSMQRYDENDPKKVRLFVSNSNFAERPALTMHHEKDGVRFTEDEGPVDKDGKKGGRPNTKSHEFAKWLKKQLDMGPCKVGELVNLSRLDGLMREPKDEGDQPSISPLYNARKILERAGDLVEEYIDRNERGYQIKWWRLVAGGCAPQEDVADRQEVPY